MPSFDDIVNELQDKINEETIEAYGQAGFERWRNSPHRGRPAKAEYEGASTGSCGDTIKIFLHIEDDTVLDAGFGTDGCGSSQISGSMAAELAVGKPCDELAAITGRDRSSRPGRPGLPARRRPALRLARRQRPARGRGGLLQADGEAGE